MMARTPIQKLLPKSKITSKDLNVERELSVELKSY